MNKKLLISSLSAAFVAGSAFAATVTWDGETSAQLDVATNWSDNAAPNTANDYVVGSNTNLAFTGNFGALIDGNVSFGSITFDTNGGGDFAIRSGTQFGRFVMSGNMTFSSTMGVTNPITVMEGANGSLNWATGTTTSAIINNSGQTVEFGNGSTRGIEFSSWNNTTGILTFGGNSDFLLTSTVTFNDTVGGAPRRLNRLYTDDNFTGTLTISNGVDVNLGNDIRNQGGTIKIEGTDTLSAGIQVDYQTAGSKEFDFSGYAQSNTNVLGSLVTFAGATDAADLRVDGSTSLFFSNLSVSGVDVDILGWTTGSSIVFTGLTQANAGEGVAFDGLTIAGSTAFMTAYDDGTVTGWAVAVPEPSTYALLAGALVLGWVMIRRRK